MIIAVHVLHLLDGWQDALAEARRVLRKPGGWLLLGRDDMAGKDGLSTVQIVGDQWSAILKSLRVKRADPCPEPGGRLIERDEPALRSYLDGLGGRPETRTLVEYPARHSPAVRGAHVFERLAAAR